MRVFPVTWQKWRSQHSIRHSGNPMLHANFTALSSIEPELLPIEVLHCGNGEFRTFWSCNLNLDPITFIYELDPYPLKMSSQTKHELSTSRLSRVIVITYRQTYRQRPQKHNHTASRAVTRRSMPTTPFPTYFHFRYRLRDLMTLKHRHTLHCPYRLQRQLGLFEVDTLPPYDAFAANTFRDFVTLTFMTFRISALPCMPTCTIFQSWVLLRLWQ